MWKRVLLTVAGLLALAGAIWGIGTYNALVRAQARVDAAWVQVRNVELRRARVIPQLVQVTQEEASYERALLGQLTDAASRAASARPADGVRPYLALEQALARTVALEEAYPRLRASDRFLGLQFELQGSQNRIAVERERYLQAVREYATLRRQFPACLLALLLRPIPPEPAAAS